MTSTTWAVSGSYFEACNCDPICPCRTVGQRPGGRSTYGVCFGTLSWCISFGHDGDVDLSGLSVVMSVRYFDDELGSPWEIILYVDYDADQAQRDSLAKIFLGRAGGTPLHNFAAAIGTVHAVRPVRISLEHARNRERIVVDQIVDVRAAGPFESDETVSCGIPGLDHPGQEVRSELLRSDDLPLVWDVRNRCGFTTDFSYSAEG